MKVTKLELQSSISLPETFKLAVATTGVNRLHHERATFGVFMTLHAQTTAGASATWEFSDSLTTRNASNITLSPDRKYLSPKQGLLQRMREIVFV